MHAWALGLTSLHPTASASLSDGSAVLQQLHADYPSYSPGGTKEPCITQACTMAPPGKYVDCIYYMRP